MAKSINKYVEEQLVAGRERFTMAAAKNGEKIVISICAVGGQDEGVKFELSQKVPNYLKVAKE